MSAWVSHLVGAVVWPAPSKRIGYKMLHPAQKDCLPTTQIYLWNAVLAPVVEPIIIITITIEAGGGLSAPTLQLESFWVGVSRGDSFIHDWLALQP